MKPYSQARDKTTVSKDFMADLLPMIRNQFMPEAEDKYWYGNLWLVQRAVTYPAKWFNERRIFVPPARYREILLDLLQDIKRHMGVPGCAPAYLLRCVQKHFDFNADRYNDEGKAARDLVGRVVGQLKPGEERPDELVRTLAAAHDLIKPPRRKPRPARSTQGDLFA